MPLSHNDLDRVARMLKRLGNPAGSRPARPTKRNKRKPVTRQQTSVYVPPLGSVAMQFLGIVRR